MAADVFHPRTLSRMGGWLYLSVILLGLAQQLAVRGQLFVGGEPTATAQHLRSSGWVWRTGIALEILMLFATIALGWVLYVLLRPVNRHLPLLALLYCTVAVAVEASFVLRALEALFPLGEAAHLIAWTTEQRAALSYAAARAHVLGFGLALLLFSPYFFVVSYLIARSGFLPAWLGMLYGVAGGSYLVLGMTQVLAPRFAASLFPFIAGPAFIGELSLCLWLLFRGVDVERWRAAQNSWRRCDSAEMESRVAV
jgi:hypothetical protein